MLLRTALESDGYEVYEAANGREALESIERNHPDLMVLDLNMPVMDGMAVLEQLRSRRANSKPRVVILTAYGSIPAAVKATRLGALDFLEKPITPTELRETVKSVLEEPQLDSPPASVPGPTGGYEEAIRRIHKALRLSDLAGAEQLLMKVAERPEQRTAEYFNLLGVVYEAQRQWRLARKCYGKAMRADKRYEPAQLNMKRLYELYTFGRSRVQVALGDDAEDEANRDPRGSAAVN
jgi:DNA-binding response OmpR family regulator